MNLYTFDRYLHQVSPIHRLDPRVKVVLTLLIILSNAWLPDGAWLAYLAGWCLLLGISYAAHITPATLLKRSLIVIPFMLAAVTLIFTYPGKALVQGHIGQWAWQISDAGLIRFASIFWRSWLSVQAAILLTTTTQFPDLMHALSHLRVPGILVNIISFMYRYLTVLADEVLRLIRARAARAAAVPHMRSGGSLWWRAQVTGHMVGQLFVRSLERSERVYEAMVARGYRGTLQVMHPHVLTRRDVWWGAGGVCLLILLQVLGHWS